MSNMGLLEIRQREPCRE